MTCFILELRAMVSPGFWANHLHPHRCLPRGGRFTHQHYGPVNITVWHQGKYKEAIYLLSNLDSPPTSPSSTRSASNRVARAIETLFSDMKKVYGSGNWFSVDIPIAHRQKVISQSSISHKILSF
ncbi:MAG: hypothetical protein AAF992_23295 [Bacteroidota bacterium]